MRYYLMLLALILLPLVLATYDKGVVVGTDTLYTPTNGFMETSADKISMIVPAILIIICMVCAAVDFGVIGITLASIVSLVILSILGIIGLSIVSVSAYIILGVILIGKMVQ
jgi:hypothetical protein